MSLVPVENQEAIRLILAALHGDGDPLKDAQERRDPFLLSYLYASWCSKNSELPKILNAWKKLSDPKWNDREAWPLITMWSAALADIRTGNAKETLIGEMIANEEILAIGQIRHLVECLIRCENAYYLTMATKLLDLVSKDEKCELASFAARNVRSENLFEQMEAFLLACGVQNITELACEAVEHNNLCVLKAICHDASTEEKNWTTVLSHVDDVTSRAIIDILLEHGSTNFQEAMEMKRERAGGHFPVRFHPLHTLKELQQEMLENRVADLEKRLAILEKLYASS